MQALYTLLLLLEWLLLTDRPRDALTRCGVHFVKHHARGHKLGKHDGLRVVCGTHCGIGLEYAFNFEGRLSFSRERYGLIIIVLLAPRLLLYVRYIIKALVVSLQGGARESLALRIV